MHWQFGDLSARIFHAVEDGKPWTGKEGDIYVIVDGTRKKLREFIDEQPRSKSEILKLSIINNIVGVLLNRITPNILLRLNILY